MLIEMRETFYEDENFKMDIERAVIPGWGKCIVVHCDVYNWKLSVLKRLYEIANKLDTNRYYTEYDYIVTFSPNPKFAKLFGGNTVMTMKVDGVEHEVIVWD